MTGPCLSGGVPHRVPPGGRAASALDTEPGHSEVTHGRPQARPSARQPDKFAGFASRPEHILAKCRLASVRHADRIYVLRDGRLIEQGTHADLLSLGGRYAELYLLQASQYST
jgi:hypothetical protein